MPRPERAIDPSAGVTEGFASDLRDLRRRAGNLSYRRMAEGRAYSATTLAEAAGGRRLPALPVTLEYVQACGGDPVEWEQRWREAARTLADQRDDGTGQAPYRGLAAFQPDDAQRFFGREALVEQLVERLDRSRLVVVSGASGSGKSSLLRAGLVPAASAQGWRASVITPGAHPSRLLVPGEPGTADRTLLVIDQFEEAYTLCRDEAERAAFLDGLATAPYRVVVGVRADFLVACGRHAELAEAMSRGTVIVGAMDADGLRRAIAEPARGAGLTVERALLAQVCADADGQPGALPLVSHALLEIWRQRSGPVLTLAGYHAAGGVTGAIAHTAERVYAGLTTDQRQTARQLLVRLTALGEGFDDTRRRVDWRELNLPGIDTVVDSFVTARLVVANEDGVEFAHEAVLAAWPRLKGWLADDRDALRLHRQITEAATIWRSLGRDTGSLYRGTRLAIAQEWRANPAHRTALTPAEAEFVDASIAAEAAAQATDLRRGRQLRRLTVALAAMLAVVTLLAGAAVWQWRTAEAERRQALSRQLATQALSVSSADVGEAMRLSLAAYRTAETVEARGALLSVANRRAYSGRLRTSTPVRDLVFSPDGGLVATGEEGGQIVVWDTARRVTQAVLKGHRSAVRALAYSPDGTRLASGGADGSLILWDHASGRPVHRVDAHGGAVDGVAFAPDGSTVATIGADHRIGLWSVAEGVRTGELSGHGGPNSDVAFTPDGRWLLSAGDDGAVVAWDVATRARIRTFGTKEPLHTVSVSPDGALIAAGGKGFQISVWDAHDGRQLAALRGHTAVVSAVRFADARTLMSVGFDSVAALWDVRRGRRIANLGRATSSLTGAAVSRDGQMFAAGSRDRSVLLWDRSTMPMTVHTDEVRALDVAPDGLTLASGDADNTALVWPLAVGPTVAGPTPLAGTAVGSGVGVSELAFAPDGRLLASADEDRLVRIWNPARPGGEVRKLRGHTDQVRSVAFHPDGRVLASGDADGGIWLWSLPTATPVARLHQPATVSRLVFSGDGRSLVSAAQNGSVTVWDAQTRQERATITEPAGILELALSPDGRLAALGRPDGVVTVWDLSTGSLVSTLREHQGPVSAVAFSADGRFLASGGFDETVVLWQTSGWRLWATLTGHGGDVLSAVWSPDSQVLFTGSTDHTITAWRVDPATARDMVCADLPRAAPEMTVPDCPGVERAIR